MMKKNFYVLSSRSIAASVALFAAVITGCDRRVEVYPAEGNAYMHDPEYRAQLDAQIKERDQLRKEMFDARDRLSAFIKDNGGDMAVITNSPRWASLTARAKRCEQMFISNRLETARITRERIARAVEDSKRIARGEAKAVALPPADEERKGAKARGAAEAAGRKGAKAAEGAKARGGVEAAGRKGAGDAK